MESPKKQKIEEAAAPPSGELRVVPLDELPQGEIPGLTLYEMAREPNLPTDSEELISIESRELNIDLTCPVCLGIIRDTRTMMECLHRFCAECISKSLRLGKRECPTCRVKCLSQRNMRSDDAFDGLISAIYPNLDEYEAEEEKKIQQINEAFIGQKTLLQSVEMGKQRQALAKPARAGRKRKHPEPNESSEPREPGRPGRKPNKEKEREKSKEKEKEKEKEPKNKEKKKEGSPEEIAFVLCTHPQETFLKQIQNRYLRSSSHLTVRHICKFLSKKLLNETDHSSFQIRLVEDEPPLADDVSLQVAQDIWQKTKKSEFILYYNHINTKI